MDPKEHKEFMKIYLEYMNMVDKDDIVKILEQLCKDFLHCLIKCKTYDIKMSLIDIINLPKNDDNAI